MGMPSIAEHHWSPEDVEALPDDGNRYECIDGMLLVTPAPRRVHQDILGRLFNALWPFVEEHRIGGLYWSPADVRLEPKALVQPDLFVCVSHTPGRRIKEWSDIAALRLAIEVLSPSTAKRDRGLKRLFYQRAGVEEYWIVHPDERMIERWRPADSRPEIMRETLHWAPLGSSKALQIDLPRLFAAALDE